MKSRLTERFGLAHPVLSAPMAGHSGGGLAAAVSEAGGLGLFGAAGHSPEWLEDQIVVAAGGIATGRALAAVLAAGADGAWMGTRFLATTEASEVSPDHRQMILESTARDTVLTSVYDIVAGSSWPQGVAGPGPGKA